MKLYFLCYMYCIHANFLRLVLYKIFDKLSELDKNREAVTKQMKFLSDTDPQEFLNKVKWTFNAEDYFTDRLSFRPSTVISV